MNKIRIINKDYMTNMASALVANGYTIIDIESSQIVNDDVYKIPLFVFKPCPAAPEINIVNQKEWWRKGNPRRKY